MRPVTRGPWPLTSGGVKENFDDYGRARRWLYERLGQYCTYCNRRLETAAVEHIRPKKPAGVRHPGRARDWNNFLLACVNCNGHKGDEDVVLKDHFWPDKDNTMRAFEYHSSGRVDFAATLSGTTDEPTARRTLALTGLDHVPKLDSAGGVPSTASDPRATDTRYEHRRAVWAKAKFARQALMNDSSASTIALVMMLVEADGYWPIWYQHLADLPGMRDELLKVTGTVKACFDSSGALVKRRGGQL